jgi:FemAB-related protein (PEP-CTERM system-associated)
MPLRLRDLDDSAAMAADWDRFVLAHPQGTFFHRAAWRRVNARAFGHATNYVAAERDGAIVGILPLVRQRTLLFGDSLISVAFCVNGGPIATDAEAFAALIARADSLMQSTGVKVMEFRYLQAPEFLPPDWIAKDGLYVIFRKPITGSDDDNLKAIPRKQRAMVRKGIGLGLTSEIDRDTARLYPIYAESVRNLGTPVFARKYFDILMDEFRDTADVVTILDGATPIASVMNFYHKDEVLPYYGGGTRAARDRYANDFMYWEVMRRAAARGSRLFDFGRSKTGTGAHAFKRNWGFEPAPLQYRFRLAPGASIPDLNPLNPKFRLFIAAWKRLPLPIAGLIGPHIVRGLG